ncbi:hypothetical protein JRG66_07660 [Salinimicrobium tongyeongense]|uniref:Dual OB-containing domain-containing protein n=1 Tax=Salinimicrobium tongyeongense TaxID=2809707 RepID=A0ABY6NW23_9FLAO|nr:hypothetical protein [Salinimicrobium tongyeongense]UZH56718.1 hypothetical protein JRG66_07660 [Salinimicrobium tongyeongense]
MEVLITSKTRWSDCCCIGGLEITTGRFLRLMTSIGSYQPINSPFQIGEVWDLNYRYHPGKPPHIEDVRVDRRQGPLRKLDDIAEFILQHCTVWQGNYNSLFSGKLKWTGNGSGHINNPSDLPTNSVGFWSSDRDLLWDGERYYRYTRRLLAVDKRLPYKGMQPAIPVIPAGTLIRVSLAKWLPSERVEDRCYLQLSGWYL